MAKELKTNACRILERNGVDYKLYTYTLPAFTDGEDVARLLGHDPAKSFKTLIIRGKSGGHYVCCLPVCAELDLKAAAKAVGEKNAELIPVKEITAVSGYVRGGCSPLGMKKQFPTVIDSSALAFDTVYFSGGRIGLHLEADPRELARCCSATFCEIAVDHGEAAL